MLASHPEEQPQCVNYWTTIYGLAMSILRGVDYQGVVGCCDITGNQFYVGEKRPY